MSPIFAGRGVLKFNPAHQEIDSPFTNNSEKMDTIQEAEEPLTRVFPQRNEDQVTDSFFEKNQVFQPSTQTQFTEENLVAQFNTP